MIRGFKWRECSSRPTRAYFWVIEPELMEELEQQSVQTLVKKDDPSYKIFVKINQFREFFEVCPGDDV